MGRVGTSTPLSNTDYGIVWRVLNDVKSHVAEVTLVADTVAAAETGASVAEDVPGKADARSKVVRVLRPQSAHGTLVGDLDRAIADLLVNIGSGSQIEVGIQARVGVVLHTVVLPTKAEIQGQPWSYLPGVLSVKRAVVVAVVAAERRFSRGQRQSAVGSNNGRGPPQSLLQGNLPCG